MLMLRSFELFQEAQRAFKDEVHRLHTSRAQTAGAISGRSLTLQSAQSSRLRPGKRAETAPTTKLERQLGSFRVQRIPRTSSPFLKAKVLRTREQQIEELCSFGGPGLNCDINGRVYAQRLLAEECATADLDVTALVSSWLSEPLRAPWHFHLSRSNGRLYFVHDELGVACSEHPDERAMRRLLAFSAKVQEMPCEGVRLLHMEMRGIDACVRKQLDPVKTLPDFEGWLDEEEEEDVATSAGERHDLPRREAAKTEILHQREVLVKNLKQYVSRVGVPRISFKSVASDQNPGQRRLNRSKQVVDSANWLQRKFDEKNMGSVLGKAIKYNSQSRVEDVPDPVALKLKTANILATQMTYPLFRVELCRDVLACRIEFPVRAADPSGVLQEQSTGLIISQCSQSRCPSQEQCVAQVSALDAHWKALVDSTVALFLCKQDTPNFFVLHRKIID